LPSFEVNLIRFSLASIVDGHWKISSGRVRHDILNSDRQWVVWRSLQLDATDRFGRSSNRRQLELRLYEFKPRLAACVVRRAIA
jgi:hypothetical protein